MSHAKSIGRFGILAVGIGIGAALAATSPTAVADPTGPFNPFPLIPDLPVAAAEVPSTLNLSISVDGFSLFSSGTAEAESGTGDIAIAYGADSFAASGTGDAGTGIFDSAFADGTHTIAESGEGNFNAASADGAFSEAGATGSSINSSSFDYASAVGAETNAEAGSFESFPGSTAPAGGDVAIVFEPSGTEGSDAFAGNGFADLATIYGEGNFAFAGLAGSYDLAAIFGDSLGAAHATGGNFLLDILPSL
jgi:hypothetical protein